MTALQERLAEVLAEHPWHHTRETHCACGFRTPLAQLAIEGYNAHLAAVAAQTVRVWVTEQREAVAEGICACIPEVFDADCPCDDHADAALGVLLDAINQLEEG